MKAREISIVRRPVEPEARLSALPVSTDDLVSEFGPGFKPGMEVSCNRCLSDCWGFEELPMFSG
jgi:hypothetical protein